MFKLLNKPIIKDTNITYWRLILALVLTVVVTFIIYPSMYQENGFKIAMLLIISIIIATFMAAAIQLLTKKIINKNFRK